MMSAIHGNETCLLERLCVLYILCVDPLKLGTETGSVYVYKY